MDDTNVTTIEKTLVPDNTLQRQVVTKRSITDPAEFGIMKFNQVIWFLIGLITILVLIRFILLLLGANAIGIVDLIYNATYIFVAPFYGIFGQPQFGKSFFETASIVAVFFYILVGLLISSLLRIFSSRAV